MYDHSACATHLMCCCTCCNLRISLALTASISAQSKVQAFLTDAQKRLGVNVIRTTASLNKIYDEIQALMLALSDSCDFILKVDTDEFLALSNHKGGIQVAGVREYLDWMPIDGSKFVIGRLMNVIPPQRHNCTATDDPAMETRFTVPTDINGYKVIFVAPSYYSSDLGGHGGVVHQPFDNSKTVISALGIVHYHNQCYKTMMRNTLRAVLSHGYINTTDTVRVRIKKCEQLVGGYKGRQCVVNSCHKVFQYLEHLYNATQSRLNYQAVMSDVKQMDFYEVRDLVLAKTGAFDYSN
jgi:hypothetical protein